MCDWLIHSATPNYFSPNGKSSLRYNAIKLNRPHWTQGPSIYTLILTQFFFDGPPIHYSNFIFGLLSLLLPAVHCCSPNFSILDVSSFSLSSIFCLFQSFKFQILRLKYWIWYFFRFFFCRSRISTQFLGSIDIDVFANLFWVICDLNWLL